MKLRSGKVKRSEPDHWSSIPDEIFGIITDKISTVDDYVRLSAVCSSWYHVATDLYPLKKNQLRSGPYYPCERNVNPNRIVLRNHASGNTYTVDLPATSCICWGSPFGWLIVFHYSDLRLRLLDPFTGATIHLPSLFNLKSDLWLNMEAFLTANPDSDPDNSVLIVSGLSKSAFLKLDKRRKNWSYIHGSSTLVDVASFQGNLYGTQYSGNYRNNIRLVKIELNHRHNGRGRALHRLVPIPPLVIYVGSQSQDHHLVNINGHLCLSVQKKVGFRVGFEVFKVDLSAGKLVPQVLGDYSLFLGNNYSFACKATYPMTRFFEELKDEFAYVRGCVFYYDSSFRCVKVSDMSRGDRDHTLKGSYRSFWILPHVK